MSNEVVASSLAELHVGNERRLKEEFYLSKNYRFRQAGRQTDR